ncbi:hypothetical protein RB195_022205 [Necator americanus]|uniref:Uncharacterized protein n=1 Tax=Necator americanus TaxID=51031 RepID=A0ABR1EED0_NECAM
MGGLTTSFPCQYRTARVPIDDSWKFARTRQLRSFTDRQHRSVSGPNEFPCEECMNADNGSSETGSRRVINFVRSSASDELSPAANKSNSRFVSSKIILELRAEFKGGTRVDLMSMTNTVATDAFVECKLNDKSSSRYNRPFSEEIEGDTRKNQIHEDLNGQDFGEISVDPHYVQNPSYYRNELCIAQAP